MLRIFLTVACVLIASLTASADGLKLNQVPATAKWLIHVDYASLSDTGFIQQLRDQKPQVTQMIQGWLQRRYGIALPEGLESITMFSSDYRPHTGSVIVAANYQPEKIEALLRKQKNHRAVQVAGHTLHTVLLKKQAKTSPSGDKEMTVVMVDDRTVLLASSPDNAKSILKLLSGNSPSLADTDSKLLPKNATNAWMVGAAIDLGELEDHPVAMPVLSQHERIHWTFGQHDKGQTYEQARLVAQSESVAKQMKTVLDGIIAYEMLYADGIEAMTKLLKDVNVRRDGNVTSFDWEGDPETVVAAMEDFLARASTWKGLFTDQGSLGHNKE